MKNCIVIGASGYSGSQLTQLILQHPKLKLIGLAVSPDSKALGQKFIELFPEYSATPEASRYIFQPWQQLANDDVDIVFLATPHSLSYELTGELLEKNIQVIDLSGAFRLRDQERAIDYYGLEQENFQLLSKAVYGLPELAGSSLIDERLIAVAGCYPSVSILSLAPLVHTGVPIGIPVINAVSGASGAGRAAKLGTSFCEVSLQAYGVGEHRHLPEIEQAIGSDAVFTPHLGNFKRGIAATITVQLGATEQRAMAQERLAEIYREYYDAANFVHIVDAIPAVHHVEKTPDAHLSVRYLSHTNTIQIFGAIDNLMKGAASSAIQCCNLANSWPETLGLKTTISSEGTYHV